MKKEKRRSKEVRDLQHRIVKLYDELTEFSGQCAFLCDSFAAIPAQTEIIEIETVEGIDFYARWLKHRILEIKEDFRIIHERAELIK